MKVLVNNSDWMFRLLEDDDGRHILCVTCGGIAMYEVSVRLQPNEIQRFQDEGESYLRELAYDIGKSLRKYQDRIVRD